MTYVVLPFQMYALTRSALAVGLIGVIEFVPMLAMALIGGALADHFDRRRLIGFVEFAMGLRCVVLAWNAALPTPHLAVLWILAGLLAGLGALHRPAMEALVQKVLPVSEMIAVGALNSIRGNFAFIVGPGLAGVIAAKGGATAAFAIDGLSYLASIATIVMMRPVARMTLGDEGITLHALLEGWRYARGGQDLLGTYLIDINATFFGMPNALFPAMAEQWGGFCRSSLCGAIARGHDRGAHIRLGSGGTSPRTGDYVGSRVVGRRNYRLRFCPVAVAGADIPCSRRSGGHGKRYLSDGGLEPDDSLVDTRSYCCNRNGQLSYRPEPRKCRSWLCCTSIRSSCICCLWGSPVRSRIFGAGYDVAEVHRLRLDRRRPSPRVG